MPRIHPIQTADADPRAKAILEGAHKALGTTPNLLATMGHSAAALQAYTGFGQAMSKASLDAGLREQIAVAIAGERSCGYCASAHTLMGQGTGVGLDELDRNLRGESSDPRVQVALQFALTMINKQGWADNDDHAALRDAGFTDGEAIEIIALVAINTFSNYLNHFAQTEIDFPVVEVKEPAAH